MGCWVVPAIAAEVWGVGLDHVLARIADGSLPSRREYGFLLVDAAPDNRPVTPPPRVGPPPPTFIPVLRESAHEVEPRVCADDPIEDGELPPLDEEEDDRSIRDWRAVRARMSRMRTPPRRRPPVAA